MEKRNVVLCGYDTIIKYFLLQEWTYISWGTWLKSSQGFFILQTQDKFKLLCRKHEQKLLVFERNVTSHKYTITWVAEQDVPVVSGCTESLALTKSAVSFRGPPSARCCRWYLFSSDKGRKRFSILRYWTSTWERRAHTHQHAQRSDTGHIFRFTMLHLGLSGLLLASKWTSFLSNCVWSTYASFTI